MHPRLKSLVLILIFVFLASGLALAVLSQIQAYHGQQVYLATQAALPEHQAKAQPYKQYANPAIGIAFSYPAELALFENATSVELRHKIPFRNSGTCDMKGESAVYEELSDFRAEIQVFRGSLAQAARELSPYMPEEHFTEDGLKVSPGFIDEFSAGEMRGLAIYEGAEGCGRMVYYFPLDPSRTLVVQNDMVQQLSGVISSDVERQILSVPGAISREKNRAILFGIIQSIKTN